MDQPIDRRGFLGGVAAVAGVAVLGGIASACASTPQATLRFPYDPNQWLQHGNGRGSTRIPITQLPGQQPGTLHLHDNRLRVIADAAKPTERECFVLDTTTDSIDSEIFSTWYPTASHGVIPQMGHVHRATGRGAIVIDQDEFAPATTWLSVWQWDGKGRLVAIRTSAARTPTSDQPVIVGWERSAGRPSYVAVYVTQTGGIRNGDVVEIVGTGRPELDGRRTVYHVFENATRQLTVTGPLLLFRNDEQATAIPFEPVRGLVQFPGTDVRTQYPVNVRSRVIGNLAQAKKWNARVPEPPWEPGTYTGGQSWQLDLADISAGRRPERGGCGILANHIYPGSSVDYDDVTITLLR